MISFLQRWWRNRKLAKLLAWAKTYDMTPEEREAQRRDFAYGNVKLSNAEVTREMVDAVADRLAREEHNDKIFVGMKEETSIGTLEICKEGRVVVLMFHPTTGKPEELHSGSDSHGAYLYLCGFATGVHERETRP